MHTPNGSYKHNNKPQWSVAHPEPLGSELMVWQASVVRPSYLSIFLYVLTPERDIRRVPVNQVLGVSLFFFVLFFLCNDSCVSSEWEKPVLAL